MLAIAALRRALRKPISRRVDPVVTPEMVRNARTVLYRHFVEGARWGAGNPDETLIQGETVMDLEAAARDSLEAALGGEKK